MRFIGEPVAAQVWFESDGQPMVKRFRWREQDYAVTSMGRTWTDDIGRHVLVMGPGERVFELVLTRQELSWRLERATQDQGVA